MQKLFSPLLGVFLTALPSPHFAQVYQFPWGKGKRGKGEGGGGGEAINAVASKLLLLLWCQTDTSLYYSEEDEGKLCNNRIRKKGHSIQSSPFGLF